MNNKFFLYIILIFSLINTSCTKQEYLDFSTLTETSTIDSNIFLRSLSTKVIDNSLRIVYCDEVTQSLKYATFDNENNQISYIDKVDTADKNNSAMGYHCYVDTPKYEYLVYEEYKSSKKMYFKIINRKKNKQNWTVDSVKINCSNFVSFNYNEDVFIMYPTDNGLIAYQYDNGLVNVNTIDNSKNAFSLQLTKTNNEDLFLLHYFENNTLIEKTMHISGNRPYTITTSTPKIIDDNIKLYDVFYDKNNNANIIYYNDETHKLTLKLSNQEPLLLGYFNGIYAIKTMIINETPFFVISTVAQSEIAKEKYQISLIYAENQQSFNEAALIYTQMPVTIMDCQYFDNKLNIIYGNSEINVSSIDIQDIFTK